MAATMETCTMKYNHSQPVLVGLSLSFKTTFATFEIGLTSFNL